MPAGAVPELLAFGPEWIDPSATTDTMLVYKKPFTPCPGCGPFPPGTTSVAGDVSGDIHIYPNPAQHVMNIQPGATSATGFQIEIRDRNGKVVRSVEGGLEGEGNVAVDVQDLPKGIYIISVRSGNDITTKRVVIN